MLCVVDDGLLGTLRRLSLQNKGEDRRTEGKEGRKEEVWVYK